MEITGGNSTSSEAFRSLFIDRRTEPKWAKGLRDRLETGETVADTVVACLLGPKGRRDLNERNAGMPVGVEVLSEVFGGDGEVLVDAEFGMTLVDVRRADGREEGKARLGCAGDGWEAIAGHSSATRPCT